MKKFLFLIILFTTGFISSNFAQDDRVNPWTSQSTFSFSILSVTGPINIPLFETDFAFRIDSIKAVVSGTTPTTDFNIFYGTSVASGTDIFSVDETVSSVTTGDLINTFANNTPVLGDWLVISISAITGTVDAFSVTVYTTKI